MCKIKKKNLIMFSALTAMLLTGCNKKEVNYNADDAATGGNAVSESSNVVHGEIFSWNESVKVGDSETIIDVKYEYPDVDKVCTTQVKERYLTPDEKKKIITYFIPEEYYDMGQFNAGYSVQNLQRDKERYTSSSRYINSDELAEYIDGRIENMPSEEAAKANFTSLNRGEAYYEYNGLQYMFQFFSDPETNESGFMAQIHGIESECEDITEVMSAEDAINKALEVCDDLNLGDYVAGECVASGGEYKLVLTRNMNGMPADSTSYINMDIDYYDEDYVETVLIKDAPYSKERVIIRIGAEGVRAIYATGLMEEISSKENINILGDEQIKKALKQYIVDTEEPRFIYQSLRFTYLRIAGENTDEYSYIPVWVLGYKSIETFSEDELYSDFFFVNAIDGSLIDVKKAGAVDKDISTYYNGFGLN